MVFCGSSPSSERKSVDERAVDVVGQQHQIGPLGLDQLRDLGDRLLVIAIPVGIAGIDDEERLDLRIFQLLDFLVGVLEAVLLRRLDRARP